MEFIFPEPLLSSLQFVLSLVDSICNSSIPELSNKQYEK